MEIMVDNSTISSFFKNKKILITGHTGFKGSWLLALLHQFEADVVGLSLENDIPNSLYNLIHNNIPHHSFIQDIRDSNKVKEFIHNTQPEIIFHLAAQALVKPSYENPVYTYDCNIIGTLNVLEAVRTLKKNCNLIIITTDKVYQNNEDQNHYFNEQDPLGGHDPYSASKACCEIITQSYIKSFYHKNDTYIKALSLRAGNVIGGGDYSSYRIMPDIVSALKYKKQIKIRNPYAVRPWQHVLDALYGYLLSAYYLHNEPNPLTAFNFGPIAEDHLMVRDVVLHSINIWGEGDWEDISDPLAPHEAQSLRLDIRRAQQILQWKPKFSAQQAIKWTLDWYKIPDIEKASFTFDQINKYLEI